MLGVITLKFKQRGFTIELCIKQMQTSIANSEDPDQTDPLGAV